MYNEKKIKKSELLQLILLDNLYAQSGSDRIIFQGGTALRWVYSGMRFSEDLDFVTDLPKEDVENILAGTFQKTQMACIAQFGPGKSEHQRKSGRKEAIRMFFKIAGLHLLRMGIELSWYHLAVSHGMHRRNSKHLCRQETKYSVSGNHH